MDDHQSMTLGDRIAWTGVVLISILCVMRAMIEHDPFPWWSSDPFVFAPPIVGLTPRWALLLNIGIILASFGTLVGQHLRGFGVSHLSAILLAIGLGVIGYHASADLETVLDSSTIAAVVCAFVTGSQIHTIPGATKVLGGVLLGFAAMLTSIGVYEVFVTHPETMRMYDQSRDSFLAARGWSADSFEAMSYERRLSNPEPIAWFGLTNVFASFVAASGAGLLTLCVAGWKQPRFMRFVALGGSMVSIVGLYLCDSKGGFAVFVLGVALGLVMIARPSFRHGKLIIGLCVLVILGLVARGLIGESLGERSLLFRYQYLIGSARVWFANPALGIGPGMFQNGYALLKPALSPEDVASPHNVAFAWIATLGLGGIAFVGILFRTVASVSLSQPKDPITSKTDGNAQLIKLGLLLVIVPTIASLNMQAPILSQSGLVPIMFGAVLWGTIATAIIRSAFDQRALGLAMLIFGAVLLVHAMIEVTGTMIVSAPIWALGIGVAIWKPKPATPERLGNLIAGVCMIGIGVFLLSRWAPINRWERALHASAEHAQVIAEVHGSLNALEDASNPDLLLAQASNQLSELLGIPLDSSLDSIINAIHRAEFLARQQASGSLLVAIESRPNHTPTRIAASQQMLWSASVLQGIGQEEDATRAWEKAISLFDLERLDAKGHRWLGNILSGRASAFRDAKDRQLWLQNAIEHYEAALFLTPHEPHLAYQIMMMYEELGESEQARLWGSRAITLHEQMRLDPIRGLSPVELEHARGALTN